MKNLLKLTNFAALALLLSIGSLYGQATLASTTLSVALTGAPSSATPGDQVDVITLASCTNLVQNSVGQWQTLLYVDTEAMDVVTRISSSPCVVQVVRGAYGTRGQLHNSSATVYLGPPSFFGGQASSGSTGTSDPSGGCIAANTPATPYININSGWIGTCVGSQWIKTQTGTMGPTASAQLITQLCTGAVTSSSTTDYVVAGENCTVTTGIPVVMSSSGTLYNFRVHSSAAATSTSSDQIATVVKNGSATAITCNLSGVAVCSDLTHSVSVAAGDLITFSYLTGTSDTAANLTMSVEKQ
jgi:hypothetical protein